MTSDTLAAQGAPELLPCHRAPQADNSLRHGHAHGKTLRLPPPKSSTGVQMTDLLNCPFCGGAASIRTDTAHSTACLIGCAKIGCFGYEQWEETEDEAIAAWNRRATPTAFAASPEVAALIREAEARGRLAGLDQANGIAERFYKKALARADAANNADDELEATASAYGSLGYAIRAEAAALRGEKEPK